MTARSIRRLPRRGRGVAAALACGLLLSACGGDDAAAPAGTPVPLDPDAAAVCDALDRMAQALAQGRRQDGLAALGELVLAVDATDDGELRAAGTSFLDALDDETDYENMTIEESVALGNQVLAEAGAGLEALGDACAAKGRPVEVAVPATAG
jgi:hypothetical protein